MASCKALRLVVELDINKVTCPGVWLPNKGEVLVRIWMLDGTSRTTSILPVFPLVYHENFLFEKIFACQRLPDLHRKLADETVRAELQQLRDGHITPLANFECSLLTLLFPEVDRPGLHCSQEVSLCMQPLFLFPGVLPPKLEISTRTVIEEAVRETARKSCIRKTISSQNLASSSRSARNVRQLARQAHSRRTPSPPRTRTPRREREKPPFVVRHVSEDIFKLPPPCKRTQNRGGSDCNCDFGGDRQSRYSKQESESDDDDEDYTPRTCHSRTCTADKACQAHCGRACTVCHLYRAYFGSNYPQHSSGCHSSQETTKPQVKFATEPSEPKCKCKIEIASEVVNQCRCEETDYTEGCTCNDTDTEPYDLRGACQCTDDSERDIGCRSELLRDIRTCECQNEDISCACEEHSISGWCRRKRNESSCPLLMDRIKDSY